MVTLTLQAAYQELANNVAFYSDPANRASLLNLAAQVDATNSTGAITLAYSIVSIGVNAALTNVNLGNGNVQTAAGTFVRSDGSSGATSTTARQGQHAKVAKPERILSSSYGINPTIFTLDLLLNG